MYIKIFKPFFDFTLALVAIILLLPVVVLVSVLLYFDNNGSVFFLQDRPGKDGKVFSIIKFKTMNDKRGNDGNLLPDSDRLSLVGSIIRRTSLDEIPQLINVLKGEMSLVGPRPLLTEYLSLYNSYQNRRHEVKPGITGWAQVNGRNAVDWKEKFEMDIWYVDNVSILLDLRILLKTIKKVFKSEGINQAGNVTMTKFNGNV